MDRSRAKELLSKLNELEQKYGRVLVERDPNYDPSGELNTSVQDLKEELAQMGIHLVWDGWEYHSAESLEPPDESPPKE